MSKHSIELKRDVIDHYLFGEESYGRTAEFFGVQRLDVMKWVAAYLIHGITGLSKRRVAYTTDFKIFVVQHMQLNQLSLVATAAHFNIPALSTILQWQRLYNAGNLIASAPANMNTAVSASTTSPDSTKPVDTRTREELLEELEDLRAEVAYLKKLDALLRAKKQAALALKKKRK
jgi:transposase-like protein